MWFDFFSFWSSLLGCLFPHIRQDGDFLFTPSTLAFLDQSAAADRAGAARGRVVPACQGRDAVGAASILGRTLGTKKGGPSAQEGLRLVSVRI